MTKESPYLINILRRSCVLALTMAQLITYSTILTLFVQTVCASVGLDQLKGSSMYPDFSLVIISYNQRVMLPLAICVMSNHRIASLLKAVVFCAMDFVVSHMLSY